jgi:hypothetical protein
MPETTIDAPRRPAWVMAGAAGAAAVLLIGVIAVVGMLWSRSTDDPASGGSTDIGRTITLTDAEADAAASCLVATPETLRARADLAFAGTVTEVSPTNARFSVERWYTGGDVDGDPATQVVLERVSDLPGLLYTPDLAAGKRYLIVASGGVLGYCDPSGPWSADLEKMYVDAFGAGTAVS